MVNNNKKKKNNKGKLYLSRGKLNENHKLIFKRKIKTNFNNILH